MEPARKHEHDIEPDFRPDLRSIPGGGETNSDRPSRDHLRILDDPAPEQKTGRHLHALENNPGGAGNDSSVREQEQESKTPLDTIKNNFTGSNVAKTVIKGKFNWKKNSALTGIIVFLLGGVGLLTTLFTPGLGLIQLKEVLTSDLNDQLSAMDIRSEYMFRAKLQNISSGVCTGVQIKCKFTTMSKRQTAKFKAAFEKAGYVIPDDGIRDTAFGRQRVVAINAPDGSRIANPADLIAARKTNPELRSVLNRIYNPLYYGLSDKVANNFLAKNKTNKQKKITGNTDEERRASIATATSGEQAGGRSVLTTADGREYVIGADGNQVFAEDNPAEFNRIKDEIDEKVGLLNDKSAPGAKAIGGVLTGAARGISVLGAGQSACAVYNVANAVIAASKVARSMQLIQYAMVVNSEVDAIKAGDGTVEGSQFLGNMMTATDNRKTIQDDMTGETIDNPFYGKSAFDSPGYKTAAYNDAPTLTVQSQQYMVGGGLSGTLSGTMTDIQSLISGGNPNATRETLRNTCGVLLSPWMIGVGLVGGIALAIGSAGVGTAISIAASAAISLAIPFLEAALADIVAGNVIGENIAGVEAGDAYFAGTAALLGGVAQNRGMTPLNEEGIQEYLAATSESRESMVAAEKHEASKTPFDINNQYSFIGSFARSLYPTSITAKSSVNGALMSVGSVLSQGFASIIQPVSAQSTYNPERFKQCNDPGYIELGISADIFCNVRYGLTSEELVMDPLEVVDYMVDNDYITSSGSPQGEYAEFIDNCVLREDGWGETSEEGGSIGKECFNETTSYEGISYFRVFTLDNSINDGMDDETIKTEEPTGIAGRPDGAIDHNRGWTFASGVDYSEYPCDTRTTDIGIVTTRSGAIIRLCSLDGWKYSTKTTRNGSYAVSSHIAGNAMSMFEAADAAGIKIGLADGMRYDGYTQHGRGLAMDIRVTTSGGGIPTICFQGVPSTQTGWGSEANAERACSRIGGEQYAAYKWLQANAGKYGFLNYLVEPWHWSTSGF